MSSVGKSTVLNALLGDTFSPVAFKQTTAGINSFRITQPPENEREEPAEPSPEQESSSKQVWLTIDEERQIQEADIVHKEISKDNKELGSSDIVKDRTFYVRTTYPICKMRKDTQLVLIDIPGINEADSSKKYKDYVESNWNTFDCVVVVMDAIQRVNTEEQVGLLKFVKSNNQNYKDIPTIVLGNKMDNLNDKDTIHLIEETRAKTIEIFGNVDCKSMPHAIEATDEEVDATDTNQGAAKTAFIPLSAKNAFTYMKFVGSIDIDQLNDPKYQDLINKIGFDEFGRSWSKMKSTDKIDAVLEILKDPVELDERLAGTNFMSFLDVLSDFVGGNARQEYIIAKQLEEELSGIRYGSLGDRAISESIFKAFKRCKSIGRTDVDGLKDGFWKVYRDYEKAAYKGFETHVDPTFMERPFMELDNYYELALVLEWTDESSKAIDGMKQLLRRQLSLLLKKLEAWDFQSYCLSAGGETVEVSRRKTQRRASGNFGDDSQKISCKDDTYFICGTKIGMIWENGWISPKDITWENLSPQDWIVVLESMSLIWNQSRFIEDFGREKVKLDAALMNFRRVFSSFFRIHFDTCKPSNPHHSICLQVYRKEIEKNGAASMTKVTMPDSLVDPSHWGFLAWKYIKFCNGRQDPENATHGDNGDSACSDSTQNNDGEDFEAHDSDDDTIDLAATSGFDLIAPPVPSNRPRRQLVRKERIGSDVSQQSPCADRVVTGFKKHKDIRLRCLVCRGKIGEKNKCPKEHTNCVLWPTILKPHQDYWTPAQYAITKMGDIIAKEETLWIRTDDLASNRLLIRLVSNRVSFARVSMKQKNTNVHPRLEKKRPKKTLRSFKDNGGAAIDGLPIFLAKCVEFLATIEKKLICMLEHANYETHVCPKFTAERFINDLNMAMSSFKHTDKFLEKINSLLGGNVDDTDSDSGGRKRPFTSFSDLPVPPENKRQHCENKKDTSGRSSSKSKRQKLKPMRLEPHFGTKGGKRKEGTTSVPVNPFAGLKDRNAVFYGNGYCFVCNDSIGSKILNKKYSQCEVLFQGQNRSKNSYKAALRKHGNISKCRIWGVYTEPKLAQYGTWTPQRYTMHVLFKLLRKDKKLWLFQDDFKGDKAYNILVQRFKRADAILAKATKHLHSVLYINKSKCGRIGLGEGVILDKDKKKAFLSKCRDLLTVSRDRLFAIIDHCNFSKKVCSNYSTEKMINDLNLATSSPHDADRIIEEMEQYLES